MKDYIAHYVIGLLGAGAGAYASQFCRHTSHRISMALLLVGVETAITVPLVG